MRPCGAWHPSSPPSSRLLRDGPADRIAGSSSTRAWPPRSRACGCPAAATCTAAARRTRCARARAASGPLQTEALHRLGRVALALGRPVRERLVEPPQVVVSERDLRRGDVLLEVLHALRAGDRHDVLASRENPRDGDLARLRIVLAGDLLDHAHELHVLVERLALEARVHAAEVALVEVVGALDRAGQEAAAERRVGHEADAQLARGVEDALLGVA